MTNDQIRARLNALAEADYKKFSASLLPGQKRPMLGVRLPALRALAREIALGDWRAYLESAPEGCFEDVMIKGFTIAYAKMTLDERLAYLRGFVPKIDNWSVCDSVTMTLKFTAAEKPAYHAFILPYIASKYEFSARFGIVALMSNFISDEYIDSTLALLASVQNEGYYAKMAVAWAVCECYIKQRGKTDAFLKNACPLDTFTMNKTIQKIGESFRVAKADKQLLHNYKK